MKWILKALLQRGLSALPNPTRWNYFFQSKVSKNLPVSDEEFFTRFELAKDRLDLYKQFGSKRLNEIHCFEFGAGWDLGGPIAYYAMGVDHQLVIDIRPGLRLELLNDQLEKLSRHSDALEKRFGVAVRRPKITSIASLEEFKNNFGIDYQAPADARDTKLPDNSIDFISTNSTLEHIPGDDVQKILNECHRIIKEDGVSVHFVDMKDHYAYFDQGLSVYNFLSLGKLAWSVVNSDLQYQNRLRITDYRKMFEKAGFKTLHEQIFQPQPEELSALRDLKLVPQFKGYLEEELSAKIVRIVSKK
jgi:hypothetical protein